MQYRLFFLFSLAFSGAFFTSVLYAHADSSASARGWAWGGSETTADGVIDGDETGLGWISLNSVNCDADDSGQSDGVGACPPSGTAIASYGVNIPIGSGELSGYAWSENVGWISFQKSDVAGCPSGVCSAYRSGNIIRGWARILSPLDAGTNAGGFEGWIKLHSEVGDPVSYGITINTAVAPARIDGYAWSNEFGWIKMHDVTVQDDDTLIICPEAATISVGGQLQLRAYYRDVRPLVNCGDLLGATEITTNTDTTWSSSDDLKATVDLGSQKGMVTGVSEGGPLTIAVAYAGFTTNMLLMVTNSGSLTCGNGVVEAGEACDEGAAFNGSCDSAIDSDGDGVTCSALCEVNICQCVI